MSIDTAEKRSSVFELPGLMTNPYPDGSIGANNRQRISDIYSGILAQVPTFLPNETCWAPANQNTSSWINAATASSSWVNSRANSSAWKKPTSRTDTWIKEKEETETWKTEDEVSPCED